MTKTLLCMIFAMTAIQAQASGIANSIVVGNVVSHYEGISSGSALVLTSKRKNAIARAAHADIMEYQASSRISVALENSIKGIQDVDSTVSYEEAMNLILASVQ